MKSGLCGTDQRRLLLILMVDGLVFGWTSTGQRGVEAAVVPPIDPFQGGKFDLLNAPPWPAPLDQFGFEQAVHRLGQGIIEAVAAAADRTGNTELGKPVVVTNRQILTAPIAVVNQLVEAARPCPRRVSSATSGRSSVRIVAEAAQPTIIRE